MLIGMLPLTSSPSAGFFVYYVYTFLFVTKKFFIIKLIKTLKHALRCLLTTSQRWVSIFKLKTIRDIVRCSSHFRAFIFLGIAVRWRFVNSCNCFFFQTALFVPLVVHLVQVFCNLLRLVPFSIFVGSSIDTFIIITFSVSVSWFLLVR